MADEHQEDVFDYPMSNHFISETCARPYRIGFRAQRDPQRPSLAHINALSDRDFAAYLRNGCRLPRDGQNMQAELDELRVELQEIRVELRAMRSAVTHATHSSLDVRGGLDVAPRR